MKQLFLSLTWVPGLALAHPGHGGASVADNGFGNSLAHYLSSSEHVAALVAATLAVTLIGGTILRRLRRGT